MKDSKFRSERERESFIKTVEELKSRAVIVEGKKDVIALESLGIHNIIPLNNTPLARFTQRIAEQVNGDVKEPGCRNKAQSEREVIILTDFDKEGRKLEKKLQALLTSYKVRTNRRLRRILMGFGKGRIEEFKDMI